MVTIILFFNILTWCPSVVLTFFRVVLWGLCQLQAFSSWVLLNIPYRSSCHARKLVENVVYFLNNHCFKKNIFYLTSFIVTLQRKPANSGIWSKKTDIMMKCENLLACKINTVVWFPTLPCFHPFIFNAVKFNLTELTTESVCVPLRVCGIVMHTHQYIRLCQCSSCLPVFCVALAPVHPAGVCIPLHFCFVCLCTRTIECVELAWVNLCSQRPSGVHVCVDPLCLL